MIMNKIWKMHACAPPTPRVGVAPFLAVLIEEDGFSTHCTLLWPSSISSHCSIQQPAMSYDHTEWLGQQYSSKHQWTNLQRPHIRCWEHWQPSRAVVWVSCCMWDCCTHTWHLSLCLTHSQLHNRFWISHVTVWLWVYWEERVGHTGGGKLSLNSYGSSRR